MQQTSATVTVVIPIRGKTHLLLRALRSCIYQTRPPSEIVLIDDSVEASERENISRIVSEFKDLLNSSKLNTGFVFVCSYGSGAASARNIGISKSSGEYIAFLDADDYFLPNKLYLQLQKMLETDADISHTNYFTSSNGVISDLTKTSINKGFNQDKFISYRECRIATPTVMIKKSIIDNQIHTFPENLSVGEDLVAWARICQLSTKPLLHLYQALSVVEVNNQSSSASKKNIQIAKKHLTSFAVIHGIEKPRIYQLGGVKRLIINSIPFKRAARHFLNRVLKEMKR